MRAREGGGDRTGPAPASPTHRRQPPINPPAMREGERSSDHTHPDRFYCPARDATHVLLPPRRASEGIVCERGSNQCRGRTTYGHIQVMALLIHTNLLVAAHHPPPPQREKRLVIRIRVVFAAWYLPPGRYTSSSSSCDQLKNGDHFHSRGMNCTAAMQHADLLSSTGGNGPLGRPIMIGKVKETKSF